MTAIATERVSITSITLAGLGRMPRAAKRPIGATVDVAMQGEAAAQEYRVVLSRGAQRGIGRVELVSRSSAPRPPDSQMMPTCILPELQTN